MKKVFIIIIAIGLAIAGFSTYRWYESRQSVYPLARAASDESAAVANSMEASPADTAQPEPVTEVKPKLEKIIIPENQVMSDQIDMHKKGENIAELNIPALEQSFSVFWGTDSNTLKKGVGMYVSKWTTTPDQLGHTVLSGHRDTVFTKLGKVKKGDEITIKYEGKQYIYSVKDIWITNSEDRTVIVKKDKPIMTLTTCYPFNYGGNAPKRYIIQAEIVSIVVL